MITICLCTTWAFLKIWSGLCFGIEKIAIYFLYFCIFLKEDSPITIINNNSISYIWLLAFLYLNITYLAYDISIYSTARYCSWRKVFRKIFYQSCCQCYIKSLVNLFYIIYSNTGSLITNCISYFGLVKVFKSVPVGNQTNWKQRSS